MKAIQNQAGGVFMRVRPAASEGQKFREVEIIGDNREFAKACPRHGTIP